MIEITCFRPCLLITAYNCEREIYSVTHRVYSLVFNVFHDLAVILKIANLCCFSFVLINVFSVKLYSGWYGFSRYENILSVNVRRIDVENNTKALVVKCSQLLLNR